MNSLSDVHVISMSPCAFQYFRTTLDVSGP